MRVASITWTIVYLLLIASATKSKAFIWLIFVFPTPRRGPGRDLTVGSAEVPQAPRGPSSPISLVPTWPKTPGPVCMRVASALPFPLVEPSGFLVLWRLMHFFYKVGALSTVVGCGVRAKPNAVAECACGLEKPFSKQCVSDSLF